jgi:hypothetical protein
MKLCEHESDASEWLEWERESEVAIIRQMNEMMMTRRRKRAEKEGQKSHFPVN